MTDCDTPFTLVNATFDWIEKNLKDDIDFVVWTGDSARHDNDEDYPRSSKQVADLNRYVVDQFVRVFGKTGKIDPKNPLDSFVVPIVPTYGNNDILPHNIFTKGPNRWTREFEDIWRGFIPQEQKHSFARGGWYFSEVIPNRLAVFSLNSLYFFDSNSAVDGCDARSEPGYEHMEWLRIQLEFIRERGMKAILTGHVPPARTESKQNWDETCFQKYTLWLRQYRDVIVASIFGHMNVDHFMFQDVAELKYKFEIDGIDSEDYEAEEGFDKFRDTSPVDTLGAKKAYLSELHDSWAGLPKPPKGASYNLLNSSIEADLVKRKKRKGGKKKKQKDIDKFYKQIGGPWGERFSLTLVSPSVVPNFFPTLRVIEYNITGMEHEHPASHIMGTPAETFYGQLDDVVEISDEEAPRAELRRRETEDVEVEKKRRKKKKKKPKRPPKPHFPVPLPPKSSSAPGPAYSPQALSLISWKQFYANLTEINAAHKEDTRSHGKHKSGKGPSVEYRLEYNTSHDKYYKMNDLTMMSWLHLAERIGREELQHGDVEISARSSGLDAATEHADAADEANRDVDDSDSDSDHESEGKDVDASKKGGKKKKKMKKAKKKKMKNHLWKEFLRRAYVHTMTDDELDEIFGS
jgi:endopolyphosphatase